MIFAHMSLCCQPFERDWLGKMLVNHLLDFPTIERAGHRQYREDKPGVMAELEKLHAEQQYPEKLNQLGTMVFQS